MHEHVWSIPTTTLHIAPSILLYDPASPATTMAFLFSILVSVLSLFAFSNAHNIQLRAHSRECFHENLHKDDRMTVTFQVGDREFGGSGNLDIDFWVR